MKCFKCLISGCFEVVSYYEPKEAEEKDRGEAGAALTTTHEILDTIASVVDHE